MFKKITIWLFFTILAGVLPLGFRWIICGITESPFTYATICSEVFFFNLIISADALKGLFDIDTHLKLRILLFSSLIFIIIVLAGEYAILLLNEYKTMDLSLDSLYACSKIFTVCCIVISLSVQIMEGVRND